jgi:hypothetical protein
MSPIQSGTYCATGLESGGLELRLGPVENIPLEKRLRLQGAIWKLLEHHFATGTGNMGHCPLCRQLLSRPSQSPATDGSQDPRPRDSSLPPVEWNTFGASSSSASTPAADQGTS